MGQRNRCQRSSPGKQSGWVLLNLGNGGMEYVFLLAKGKANVVRSGSCFGEQERRHRFGEQDKDKSLSGSNHPGAFLRQSITYVNHYGQVHRVIFMLVALQR